MLKTKLVIPGINQDISVPKEDRSLSLGREPGLSSISWNLIVSNPWWKKCCYKLSGLVQKHHLVLVGDAWKSPTSRHDKRSSPDHPVESPASPWQRCWWEALEKKHAGWKQKGTWGVNQNSLFPISLQLYLMFTGSDSKWAYRWMLQYLIRWPPGSWRKQFTMPTIPEVPQLEAVSHTDCSEGSARIS